MQFPLLVVLLDKRRKELDHFQPTAMKLAFEMHNRIARNAYDEWMETKDTRNQTNNKHQQTLKGSWSVCL